MRCFWLPLAADDGVALDMDDAFALGTVRDEHGVHAVLGEEDHVAVAVVRHCRNHRGRPR
jgi:hypothetical protein